MKTKELNQILHPGDIYHICARQTLAPKNMGITVVFGEFIGYVNGIFYFNNANKNDHIPGWGFRPENIVKIKDARQVHWMDHKTGGWI